MERAPLRRAHPHKKLARCWSLHQSRARISYPRGLEVRRVKALVEDVIENPSLEVLEEYLDISGFDDPYTWWLTAKALHGSDPKFLVVLRLL